MDDDRPRSRAPDGDFGAASFLAGESLDRYSLGELDARLALLDDEIVRVTEHRRVKAAHLSDADALFGSRSS